MYKILLTFLTLTVSVSALTLPNSIYKNATITPQSSYKIYENMRDATILFRKGKVKDSTALFIKTLEIASKSKKEKNIDQYDYLYAHYGILSAIENDEKEEETYIKLSKKILRYLDKATSRGIWEEGELGQFQLKMYKTIGNHLAELLYVDSKRKDKKKMKEALRYINKAEKYIRDERDFYIKDTKAKITNALEGNPPLTSEKDKIKVIKHIKVEKDLKKVPQKQ